ncbi:MAG: IS200/IS605 family transposase [Candidatus Marinimicrobia bacterium]|nr:IS200/IS605 family transposase [Candidatus Neomarinimicrobiota bacterium]
MNFFCDDNHTSKLAIEILYHCCYFLAWGHIDNYSIILILEPYKRDKVLTENNQIRLYSYIKQIVENKNCKLYAIDGIEDHVHILVSIRADISISDFIKDAKVSSSVFIKREKLFPYFKSWATGYSIFTRSYESLDTLIKYIENQKKHHKNKSYYEEYGELLK